MTSMLDEAVLCGECWLTSMDGSPVCTNESHQATREQTANNEGDRHCQTDLFATADATAIHS